MFNPGAWFLSQNGEMFFGGINGFNSFNPHQVKDNPFLPPIVLTDFFTLKKQVYSDGPISSQDRIHLTTDDRYIFFEFAALCFSDTGKNQYAYMLEGRDTSWVYQGADREVTVTDLTKGKYVLRVKASNNHGVWNEEGFSIQIEVSRPFLEKTWFKILVALVLIALVVWIYRTRKTQQLLQSDDEENLKRFFKKHKISSREQDIIRLILQGKGNKEIGQKLFISKNTVRNHTHNIYQKLNVKNRFHLIDFVRKGK
jgi:DNA-binding CsgD family transcriptional regulator